jgi:spore coat protein U-like protein
MKKLLAVAAGTATLLVAGSLAAASATATLGVTVTVTNNCQIATAPVAFGTYDPLVANLTTPQTAAGSVMIACTQGTAETIALDFGSNPSGTARRMSGGGAYFVAYELFQPSSTAAGAACNYAGATAWGTTGAQAFTPPPAPSRDARTYNVCGRIPAAQDVPAASYADMVLATVNF